MSKRRYSAAKRAREINKQQERARKLARKHGKSADRATPDGAGQVPETETPGGVIPVLPAGTSTDAQAAAAADTPGDSDSDTK